MQSIVYKAETLNNGKFERRVRRSGGAVVGGKKRYLMDVSKNPQEDPNEVFCDRTNKRKRGAVCEFDEYYVCGTRSTSSRTIDDGYPTVFDKETVKREKKRNSAGKVGNVVRKSSESQVVLPSIKSLQVNGDDGASLLYSDNTCVEECCCYCHSYSCCCLPQVPSPSSVTPRSIGDFSEFDASNDVKDMLQAEDTHVKPKLYLQNHPQLNSRMRPILIDWLMEVSADYLLHRRTLYLAIYLLDVLLSGTSDTPTTLLQCYGAAALYVAMKMEESSSCVPKLVDMAKLSMGAFTPSQLKTAEFQIVDAASWSLCVPVIPDFISAFVHRARSFFPSLFSDTVSSADIFSLACDYADLAVHCYDSLTFSASKLAASCFYLSISSFFTPILSPQDFDRITGYTFSSLCDCLHFLERLSKNLTNPCQKSPCCDINHRYSPRLLASHKSTNNDFSWYYQPHHKHLLPQFHSYFLIKSV
ncbi:G1/S-specific cyclin-E1 [Zancudomyces culisetae]|uniref:G1/S-specific cyclin-E1 n=1 Tax=Zancudomyces culisetae TaxID=1213189 RepID=A0A1R1PUE0_ZANCU|nr:G1/S-specific cyclin-E1 [Zancudomyces culisetae]|eukprot:OMH84608.1 G1/S-specific cyclin-E1 [Zancudomyces culisetae]